MHLLATLVLCFVGVHAISVTDLFPYRIERTWSNASCVVKSGRVPSWLNGYFVRQTCGAFGNQAKPQTQPPTKIEHLFDCLGMVTTYNFRAGHANFSNRLYDTHAYKVWQSYHFDFEKSKIAWPTLFSLYDPQQAAKYLNNWTEADGFYEGSANVNFWAMTSRTDGSGSFISEAVDEGVHGLGINVRSLEMYGPYKFNDDLEKPGTILIGNPAHGAIDEAGVRWSTVGHYEFTSQSTGTVSAVIYTIERNARVVQGVYKLGDFDLSLCRGDYKTVYPNLEDMMGYMHSFILTPNYVVLPLSSLGWNFCGIFLPRPPTDPGRFFFRSTTYQKQKPARFLVFDRETKKFVANIASSHFFVTHQANWYEDEKGNIVADMITYDVSVYGNLFLEDIINNFAGKDMRASFDRFVIDTNDWSVSRKQFPMPADPAKEFCQINHAFHFKPYEHVYMVSRPFMKSSSIIKYNVEVGEVEHRWGPFPEVYPGEPIFVPAPGGTEEDDGVLLVGGVDASDEKRGAKGFVAVLDARTLEELFVGLAPENTPLGLHNYFSPE